MKKRGRPWGGSIIPRSPLVLLTIPGRINQAVYTFRDTYEPVGKPIPNPTARYPFRSTQKPLGKLIENSKVRPYIGSKAADHKKAGPRNMEGAVVGASAPEIGAENKGRAMLEKMGWSSGMRQVSKA